MTSGDFNPYAEAEASRLALPNLPLTRKRVSVTPDPSRVAQGKWARRRGIVGEREVVKRYAAHGFPNAHRQPMSGGMRVYGAGDLSPWPGDIGGVEPWLVEIKRSKYVDVPCRGGWDGQGFIRPVLRELAKLAVRHPLTTPVLWARGDRSSWRIWVPARLLVTRATREEWLELTEDIYWHEVAA